MTMRRNEIDKAYDRILIIKAIIRSERRRAEAAPRERRNVDLGIVEADQTHAVAKEQIVQTFNDIELLLDHLHVSHLAASFESEAMARLGTVIGRARTVIKKEWKSGEHWPVNLVRSQDSFEGLHDIERIIGLPADLQASYSLIRRCRNDFSHGARIKTVPKISSNDTREILIALLEMLQ